MSGYSVYNPILLKKAKTNPLKEKGHLYPDFPNKKFEVLYADPPWDYGGKSQFDKTLNKNLNPDYQKRIFLSTSSFKYPTMKFNELVELPIKNITADNCILFLWSTNPHLEQAINLGKRWGFEYKTVAFVWNKMNHNPGQYTLSYCELCLLFKKRQNSQKRRQKYKATGQHPQKGTQQKTG